MRGMSTADSPIGNEALRQLSRFSSDLASRKAQSALDLSNTGANFAQGVSQFGSSLQQQALQNRMALAAMDIGTSFGSLGARRMRANSPRRRCFSLRATVISLTSTRAPSSTQRRR
jgi:hypothetical protein